MTDGDITFNARELVDALRNSSVRLYENALDAIAESLGRIGTWTEDEEGNMILLEDDEVRGDIEDFDAETHNHTPHDYYTPTGPSDSPDVSGYLSQDSQGSINTFMGEEGSAPVQDPMEFGEMANWTPLDGSEGLKRKRAETGDILNKYLNDDSPDQFTQQEYDRLISMNGYGDDDFDMAQAVLEIAGDRNRMNAEEPNKVSAQQIADEYQQAQRKDMEDTLNSNASTNRYVYARGEVSNKHMKAVYDKYGTAAIMAAVEEMHHKKMNAETTCASCSEVIAEDDIIGDGTNRGLCCVPDYYGAESFSAEYSGPSTLSSALSGARKTGRNGKHLTIVQRLVAKYGIDKGVKIYKHFGIKQKRASPKVRGKVRGTKSGPRRYSEGRVGGAGRSQVYQKGDRTGSWTPSGGHTTRFANSGKAWYQERGLGTPVAGPIPDTDLAGKSMGEKLRGSFVNPHGIVGYPFVPAQQRERKSKK